MNVCMRYELYALCIERAGDKKSRAYGRRDSTFRAGERRGKERRRAFSVLSLDRYYFVNRNKKYPTIIALFDFKTTCEAV